MSMPPYELNQSHKDNGPEDQSPYFSGRQIFIMHEKIHGIR